MDNHLTNIEIKDFKCFKDFKADGFKRVNLIGGKNNVGKTAFMEACFINVHSQNLKASLFSLCTIKLMRETLNILENLISKKEKLEILTDLKSSLEQTNNIYTNSNKNETEFKIKDKDGIKEYNFKFNNKNILVNIKDFSFEVDEVKNINFIDNYGLPNNQTIHAYSYIQKMDREPFLNKILKDFDKRIESFKVIDEKVQCKVMGKYYEITELGDGVGNLVSIVASLFQSKDGCLFIDEIENGFHYSFLEKLWEIILKISNEQNVQIFATTHSKECIYAYAKISKYLVEKEKIYKNEINFLGLGLGNLNEINAISMDYEAFQDEIKMDNEIRGW